MGNHYHLLVKTPQANLGRAMRHINGVYTQRFNKNQKTDGSLFRGRYKALIVEKEDYLLQVSRYIHLNPIAAKITASLKDYPWSSYLDYISKEKSTTWLRVDEVRSMLNASNHRLAYLKFIEAGVDQETREFYEKKNMPVILGSDAFKEEILSHIGEEQIQSSRTDYNKVKNLPSMSDVDQVCVNYFNVDKDSLLKAYGKGNEARKIAIYGSRVWAKEKNSVIAAHYHCQSGSSVCNAVNSVNEKIKLDVQFANEIKKIHKMLPA